MTMQSFPSKFTDLRGASLSPTSTAAVFTTGGKPSTWFPPGGLVEQSPKQRQHSKRLAIDDRAARRSQATKQQQELRTRQVHYEQTNERTNKQTNKQTNERTNQQQTTQKSKLKTNKHRQRDRKTRQTNIQTEKADRQTDRWTD